jgi:hypothetical protein
MAVTEFIIHQLFVGVIDFVECLSLVKFHATGFMRCVIRLSKLTNAGVLKKILHGLVSSLKPVSFSKPISF